MERDSKPLPWRPASEDTPRTLWLLGLILSAACTDAKTEAAAKEATKAFCASGKHGCSFKLNAPDAKSEERSVVAWLIHSLDESGKPRFMPEGSRIVRVSKECRVVRVSGHGP